MGRDKFPQIKVTFNKFGDSDPKSFFLVKFLFEKFNVVRESDPNKADLIFELAIRDGKSYIDLNKPTIITSGDNIFFKKNVFSILEALIKRFGAGNNRKHKVMDKLDSWIPYWIQKIPIVNFLPKYVKFVKDLKKGKKKKYAILTDYVDANNILVMPFFIQEYLDKLKNLRKKDLDISHRKKFCAFIVSSNSGRERVRFFKKLSQYKKVDSYGKVMNNVSIDKLPAHWHNNKNIFKNYKFVICFENSTDKDYITEKITNVMFGGAIPIYRGAPNIGDYFNKKSFINYDDYGSYEKMIEKIIELDNDDYKYLEMLKEPWLTPKNWEIISSMKKKLYLFYNRIISENLK